MRPIERKILSKIDEKGATFDRVEEIIDGMTRQELKKSFPDDSIFQSPRYFAKVVLDSLLRRGAITKQDGKFVKPSKKED